MPAPRPRQRWYATVRCSPLTNPIPKQAFYALTIVPRITFIGSVAICKETDCTLFAGDNCNYADPEHYSVDILGHGDIAKFKMPGGIGFRNVLCGPGRFDIPTSENLSSVSEASFSIVPVSQSAVSLFGLTDMYHRRRISRDSVPRRTSQANVRPDAWPILRTIHR